jgi:predicted amidohydrolase YtcJ
MFTEEPPDGRIERDLETGEPNGVLINMLGNIRSKVMPPFTEDELYEGIGLVDELFLSQGITSAQEATISNDTRRWETVCDFVLNEDLHCRMNLMAGFPHWREFQERRLKTFIGDDLMRLGAVKVMLGVKEGALPRRRTTSTANAWKSTRPVSSLPSTPSPSPWSMPP